MLLLLALVAVAPLAIQAQDISSNVICRFAVAVPEMEGPVTLGIFSAQGNLVRLLHREATVDSIPAGLNGLLIGWDGKDDSGVDVPPGTYRARGLVHGPVIASALPVQEGNGLCAFASDDYPTPLRVWNPFPGNHLTVLSASDALLEKRKPLAITAKVQDNEVIVEVEGLPLIFIPRSPMGPIEPMSTRLPVTGIELQQGSKPGMAKLTVTRPGRSESYSLAGLNHLVPLDAGALEMPSDTFHLPREAVGTAGSQQ